MRISPALAISCLLAACAPRDGARASSGPETPATVDLEEHAFFDGEGRPAKLETFVSGLADIDFVGLGELHFHGVGSRIELDVLEQMAGQARPVALAMEFFEADTQPALDAYLAGTIDETTFRERTGRDAKYDDSHRPLIEFCKQHGIPVIAANAPRPLVTRYRKTGGGDYPAFFASLSEEDRALLPRSSLPPDDEFKRRFMQTMGPRRGPAFYPSMCLWNDAMAEAIADFRADHPDHRVLLIVGAFHVAHGLGTVTQYENRRPDDTTRVLLMSAAVGPMAFSADDRAAGDLVLKVRAPAEG